MIALSVTQGRLMFFLRRRLRLLPPPAGDAQVADAGMREAGPGRI
jgi:hypothetical protein